MTQNHIPSVIAKIKTVVLERLHADLWFQEYFKSRPEYKKFEHEKEKEEGMIKEAVRLIGKNDPSPKKGFTSWIIESYLDGGIKSLEDLGRVNMALRTFQEWRKSNKDKRLKKADINRYCGITGCRQERSSKERRVAPYTMLMTGPACHPTNLEEDKISLSDSDGNLLDGLCEWSLEDFIETVTPKSHLELSNHEGFQGDIVYRGATADLVWLSSERSAKYWGKGTRWCTAADRENMFHHYNNQGPLYVIADRAKGKDRYQLHPATRQFMNIRDVPVKLGYLANRYPDLVIQESKERYGPKWNPSLITSSTYRLRLGPDNHVILQTEYSFPEHYSDDTNNFSLDRYGDNSNEAVKVPNSIEWYDGLDLRGVKALKFRTDFNKPIEGFDLKGVQTLTFGWYFNQKVEELNLKVVKSLTFGFSFNQKVEGLDLKGVKSLIFGQDFNQPVNELDLKGVESLTFDWEFNQRVEGLDLKAVKSINFGRNFNQPIEGLDLKGVTSLEFGWMFNQSIEGLDLKGVKALVFGNQFNQPIEGLDLKGVKTLEYCGKTPLERLDLKGVETLGFGYDFNQKVEGLDLKNLRLLTAPKETVAEIINKKNIRDLEIFYYEEVIDEEEEGEGDEGDGDEGESEGE